MIYTIVILSILSLVIILDIFRNISERKLQNASISIIILILMIIAIFIQANLINQIK